MTKVLEITHSTGDLSQWSSTTTDGGDLSVTAEAALAGTNYGLSLLINDANNLVAAQDLTKAPKLRYRFYIDPNSIAGVGDWVVNVQQVFQTGGGYRNIIVCTLERTGGVYSLVVSAYNDSNGLSFETSAIITDAPHYVEIYETSATSDISSDGTFEWWLDGVSQGSVSNVDNYNDFVDSNWGINFCFKYPSGAPIGTFYMDELVVNDDGGVIGPISIPVSGFGRLVGNERNYVVVGGR